MQSSYHFEVKKLPSSDRPVEHQLDEKAALAQLARDHGEAAPLTADRRSIRRTARVLGIDLTKFPPTARTHGPLLAAVLAELKRRYPEHCRPVEHDPPGYARARSLATLTDRVRVLVMQKMTEAERLAGLHIEDVRPRLRGVFGPTARVGETAAALRALGWVRVRKWALNEAGNFETRWFPPGSPEALAEVERLRRLTERRQAQAMQKGTASNDTPVSNVERADHCAAEHQDHDEADAIDWDALFDQDHDEAEV